MNRGPEPRPSQLEGRFADSRRHNITMNLTSASRCAAGAGYRARWADGRVPRQSGPTGSSSGYGGLRTEKERL